MLENLSEEALAQLREEAESLHQQGKSSVENPFS
jgi:vacuolar-type H+-ATPase subunit E/Vma4